VWEKTRKSLKNLGVFTFCNGLRFPLVSQKVTNRLLAKQKIGGFLILKKRCRKNFVREKFQNSVAKVRNSDKNSLDFDAFDITFDVNQKLYQIPQLAIHKRIVKLGHTISFQITGMDQIRHGSKWIPCLLLFDPCRIFGFT
jgi:hypothetical protein